MFTNDPEVRGTGVNSVLPYSLPLLGLRKKKVDSENIY